MEQSRYTVRRDSTFNQPHPNVTVRENGDGAYRKPISLIENQAVPPSEPRPDYDESEVVKHCFVCCVCCGPRAIACGKHWRTWLRYSFYAVYVCCILVAIPVIVVIYKRERHPLDC